MGLIAQAPLEVKVIAPDNLFRFAPRVEVPGRPTLGLVFSGGGARGVAQIGVIQRLEEVGFPVDNITGTSAGSLMGALMASGFSGTEIEELFTRVDFNRAFLDPLLRSEGTTLSEDEAGNGTFLSFQLDAGLPSFALALRDGVEIQRTLEGLLARGAFYSGSDFNGLKYPLRVVATNLETGQGRVFDHGDLVEALRASMAVPGAFRPVVVDGHPYVDGALVENLPVFTAKEAFHPELILAVDVSAPLERRAVSNFFSLAARSLDVVVERRQWESRAAASILLRPQLPMMNFTDYGSRVPALVEAGRKAFDAGIPELRKALFRDLGGEEILSRLPVEVNTPRPLPAEAAAMLARVVPAGPVLRQDAIVAIQQLLLHGWAKEARGSVTGQGPQAVLRLEVTPFARVRGLTLQAPARWQERLSADLKARFPLGEPFNPEAFGVVLGNWVHQFVVDGTPLVDVRGSGFNDATGVLDVVVKEPLIRVITVRKGRKNSEKYIQDLLAVLKGQPLQTVKLRRLIGLAEHRLHLQELRYQLYPVDAAPGSAVGPGVEILLTPVYHQTQSLDLSLGYDTTLGGESGFSYRSLNFGGTGVEAELSGSRNRLQDRAFLALRGPMVSSLPGAGMELWAASSRQRLDQPLTWVAPEINGSGADARIGKRDLGLGWNASYGNRGQGKARLDVSWRQADFESVDQRLVRHQELLELSSEWDNFDRHTFPRDGLMLRGRYGLGDAMPGPAPSGVFRFGYLRARGLSTFGSPGPGAEFGLDLDAEWGSGGGLPLDRWWPLGGTSFIIGSQPLEYLVPSFLAVRLGLPLRVAGLFGSSLQVIPRLDYGLMAGGSAQLFRSQRSLGSGLLLRTILTKFYLELGYGFLRQAPVGGKWGPASGSFSAIIGSKPFDLWKRH